MTLCGVPVEGEAGVGYMIRGGFEASPLMFNRDEIEALVIGARMVESWTGKVLAASARVALPRLKQPFLMVYEASLTAPGSFHSTPKMATRLGTHLS
jgi:predicted DNA-binding transcriptional regulator YafY